MDDAQKLSVIERGAMGGEARAEKLAASRKSEIAKLAAEARWNSDLPQATHDGPLIIDDKVLVAAVLPNGKRLLAQGTFLQALGRSRTPKAGTGGKSATVDTLPFFLQAESLKPFISDDLRLSTTPIFFRMTSGRKAVGYDALLLPMVCKVYQQFRDSLVEKLADGKTSERAQAKRMYSKYKHIISACDQLVHGFGLRGIIALVDDATGYRADRTKEDVLRVISKYIAPSLVAWTRRFPPEFFEEVYTLHGWEYRPGSVRHPQCVGNFINHFVYEPLPPGVLEEMKNRLPKNESGNRKAKLWQTLTIDTGIPHLDQQIKDVTLMMRLSSSKEDFVRNFEKIFGKQLQLRLQVLAEFKELTA